MTRVTADVLHSGITLEGFFLFFFLILLLSHQKKQSCDGIAGMEKEVLNLSPLQPPPRLTWRESCVAAAAAQTSKVERVEPRKLNDGRKSG